MAQPFDLSLGLEGTHVLITGGCGLIGRVVVEAFLTAGANVSVLDLPEAIAQRQYYGARHNSILFVPVDITQAESVNAAFLKAEDGFGAVECCVALASMDLSSLQQTESICDMDSKVRPHWLFEKKLFLADRICAGLAKCLQCQHQWHFPNRTTLAPRHPLRTWRSNRSIQSPQRKPRHHGF